MERGTQIAYIPHHANGDVTHPDVEFGFVTSVGKGVAFCRYWSRHRLDELRTTANSEATPLECIKILESHPQQEVEEALNLFCSIPPF